MMYNKYIEMKYEAVELIIEVLGAGYTGYYCDLHNEAFNTEYYIIGTFEAKQVLTEYDVFEAIELVQEYEKTNFGEIYTNISDPEHLLNMVFYIIGEETNTIIINFLKELKY